MLLRHWEEIVDALEPGHAKRLAETAQAEGWLLRAMELKQCPWLMSAGVYKDDDSEDILEYPFTLTQLCEFLDAGPLARMKALAVDGERGE
jgi:hypothetical protein